MAWTAEDHRRQQRIFKEKSYEKLNQARRHNSKCKHCKSGDPCQTWYNLYDKAADYQQRANSAASAAYKLEKGE